MTELSRRNFVRASAAALAAGAAVAGPGAAGVPTTERRDLKACVIGHTGRGDYGHAIDQAFQRIPGVKVGAVADPDERGRRAAAIRIGAERSYADWREMLEKEKPDLVAIGMRWIEGRAEVAMGAARAGAHLYLEKPLATSLQEADAILAAAEAARVQVAVAHQALLAPAVMHLKRLLGEGVIGRLLEVRARGKEDRRSGGEGRMVLG